MRAARRGPGLLLPLVIAVALVAVVPHEARGDRVADLSSVLRSSKSSDKARIAAAVSLGRMQHARTLRPLVEALRDRSNVVRSVAASALGHLGDARALPALRRASRDRDKTVRKRATQAIAAIRSDGGKRRARSIHSQRHRSAHYRIDGREPPRLQTPDPELFVIVKSATDESPGRLSKKSRAVRAAYMKARILDELDDSERVTLSSATAADLKLTAYSVDLSILKLRREVRGPVVELACEIRIAVSDTRGKMISILTGGAKVQVPRRKFRKQYEPQMRKEALENAVKSVHQDLVTYLRKKPT